MIQMVWHNFVESIMCFTSGCPMLFHRGVNNGDIAFQTIWCIGRTKGAHYSLMSGMKKMVAIQAQVLQQKISIFLFYTGNVRDAEGGRETYQCVAVSDDGKSFQKEGPVIYLPDGYTAHFRDPKVWKKNNSWWMVVGAQTKELQGNVALFESNNLKKWDYRGNLLDPSMDWGYMCECPDIVDIDGQQF